jgi:hypothetical protein
MKRTYTLALALKGSEEVYRKGFPAGVIATQEMTFDLTNEEYDGIQFAAQLLRQMDTLQEECVEARIQSISGEGVEDWFAGKKGDSDETAD